MSARTVLFLAGLAAVLGFQAFCIGAIEDGNQKLVTKLGTAGLLFGLPFTVLLLLMVLRGTPGMPYGLPGVVGALFLIGLLPIPAAALLSGAMLSSAGSWLVSSVALVQLPLAAVIILGVIMSPLLDRARPVPVLWREPRTTLQITRRVTVWRRRD